MRLAISFIVLGTICVWDICSGQGPSPEFVAGLGALIQKLTDPPINPKGLGYPRIRGPKCLNSKIGVIGGGPSGVHVAYLLKKYGFDDVTILEATNRLGGKSKTITLNGGKQFVTTAFLSQDFYKTLIPLLKKFGLFENTGVFTGISAILWPENSPSQDPFLFAQWVIGDVMQNFGAANPETAFDMLLDGAERYTYLHQEMFGTYDFLLMPRPNYHVMQELKGSIADFLKRNHLEVLYRFFQIAFTSNAYG